MLVSFNRRGKLCLSHISYSHLSPGVHFNKQTHDLLLTLKTYLGEGQAQSVEAYRKLDIVSYWLCGMCFALI